MNGLGAFLIGMLASMYSFGMITTAVITVWYVSHYILGGLKNGMRKLSSDE